MDNGRVLRMTPRGIHRIKNEPPSENGVWITDGDQSSEIRESAYRRKQFEPAIETLPWDTSRPGGGNAART